jgi:YidC/Oxa1 family membrane protein insertase
MDEKRVLIAFALVFAVLFGFNFYASRHAAKAPQPESSELVANPAESTTGAGELQASDGTGEAPSKPATAEAGAAAVETGAVDLSVPGAGREEARLTVETPLWVATLSSRGGSITSWLLTEYSGATGSPIELVREGARGLETEVRHGALKVPTSDWIFDGPGTDRLVVEEVSGPASVRYEATTASGIRVVKQYTFYPDRYSFDLAVEVEGLVEPAPERELWIGWPGILATEKKEDPSSLASVALVGGKATRTNVGTLRKVESKRLVGEIAWTTSQSRYFMAAVVPEGATFQTVEAFADPKATWAGFRGALPIGGESGSLRMRVFVGPQDYRLVSGMGVGLEKAIDFGWAVLRPLSVWVLQAMVWSYRIIPNYGVIIILFSIITKLLFYRLTHKSFAEMKRMQDLQPKLAELKEKHKENKEQFAKAQMELYKKEKVNPLGGCLPMLLQMPVFIVLYQVLRTTIELRGAPFALWMTDLSQPDLLVQLGPLPVRLLPLLMGVGMFVQQRLSTKDPSQALVGNMMPILFTFLFYNIASGLVLYWFVNTILSVAQQYYIHRGLAAAEVRTGDAAAPESVHDQPSTSSATASPQFVQDSARVAGSDPAPRGRDQGRSGRRRRRKK